MTASPHLRGIVIAGGLAVLALALGFVTLSMNQTASKASVHTVLPLKLRHHATTRAKTPTTAKAAKTAAKKPALRVDKNFKAAVAAGLPAPVARALAKRPVVVVELSSSVDPVAKLSTGEAKAGAQLAGAAFVEVSVDRNGDVVSKLARALGQLPSAPAAVVYTRPATAYVTLPGFNDRTTVEQAAANALASFRAQAAGTSAGAATTPPAAPAATAPAASPSTSLPSVASQTGSA
jgi:hypothetical protein